MGVGPLSDVTAVPREVGHVVEVDVAGRRVAVVEDVAVGGGRRRAGRRHGARHRCRVRRLVARTLKDIVQ